MKRRVFFDLLFEMWLLNEKLSSLADRVECSDCEKLFEIEKDLNVPMDWSHQTQTDIVLIG